MCPVGHVDGCKVFCSQCLGYQEPHLSTADDKDMPAPETSYLFFGKLDRGRTDRDRTTVYPGSFPAFDSDMDGFVYTELKDIVACTSLLCVGQCGPELTNDLVFP